MSELALIRKCVVPAAGLGTRFLPASKAIPKEMLAIVDKPTIQYIVEEAVSAGIRDIILVNGRGKGCIEDHFDFAVELEAVLKARNKQEELRKLREIAQLANIISVRQKEPLGLGHAVLQAGNLIANEPFGVILADDIIDAEKPAIRQLASVYQQFRKGIVALMDVPPDQAHLYGIAAGEEIAPDTIRVNQLVEKPKSGTAPSNLAVIGRYILPASVFEILARQRPGVGQEIQLTDALAELAKTEGLIGYKFKGQRYDAGDKMGYLKANVAFALKRGEMREPLLAFLRETLAEAGPGVKGQ
jgi:UTP--glucose-1-phosphate uridylyltransferase